MKKGDIVLVNFPFSDYSEFKPRPALILINRNQEITVCFITSKKDFVEDYDIELFPDNINRLKKPSLIKASKLTTIESKLILGLIGKLDYETVMKLDFSLKKLLQLQ